MLAIVVYILVWTILIQQKYLSTERPVGSIRLSLLQPLLPRSLVDLPYCLLPNRTTLNGDDIYPCIYQDESFVVFPETEATAMFATTRYTYSKQILNCSLLLDPNCYYNTTFMETYFIGDIESFTLLIDHTVYAPVVGIQENAKSLKGSIKYHNGSTMDLEPGTVDVIGERDQPDVIRLKTLLQAAGIESLDDQSLANTSTSMRYDGIVLMIFIDYSNTHSYNLNDLTYSYMPSLISRTKFKSVEPLLGNNSRELYNRHGIRMIFVQDGLLGKFDFQVMLITFVTGLGLLTVSTVVVDLIALHFLPQKKIYGDYKYEVTEEMEWRLVDRNGGSSDNEEKAPINQSTLRNFQAVPAQ